MNITPGGVAVKSMLKVRPQEGEPVQALGMVEVDDQQTSAGVDGRSFVKTVSPRMRRFQKAGAFEKIVEPADHEPIVGETTIMLPHAPDDPTAALEAQIRVAVTAEQKKNGRAVGRQGDQIDPARGQLRVHGHNAGMAQKEPVGNGAPPVHLRADPTPDMLVMFSEFRQILNSLGLRGGV